MKLISPTTLRALMDQHGFSHRRLARYAGCHNSMIDHLVSGRRTTCTPQRAAMIAEALSVPLEVLFVPSDSPTEVQDDKQQQTRKVA